MNRDDDGSIYKNNYRKNYKRIKIKILSTRRKFNSDKNNLEKVIPNLKKFQYLKIIISP